MADCQLVLHTASPFNLTASDARRDLIEPAVSGTRNVLEAANRTESVRRVVLTSSCAAIYGDNRDLRGLPGQTVTEEHWNTTSDEHHQAYQGHLVLSEPPAHKLPLGSDVGCSLVINGRF